MKVISVTGTLKLKRICVAIGIFDGVHLGHQFLLKAMLKKAREINAKSAVITFSPHPVHVLRPDIKLGHIVSLEHRLKLLERLGVDLCLIVPFSKKFAHVRPEYFIRQVLAKRLGVKAIFVGEDFRFGRERRGDIHLFQALAKECGYEIQGIEAITQAGLPISSTRLRRLITEGDLSGAKKLLGRFFSVRAKVVKGKGRGRTLGFPTANVDYKNDIMPPLGVYAVRVFWKNKILNGIANLGVRPTFKDNKPKMLLEVHLLDVTIDLYGQTIEVEMIKRIRDERTFTSKDMLITQIQKDVLKARRILI